MVRSIWWSLIIAITLSGTAFGNAPKDALVQSLERLAKEGNAEALYHIGMAYHTGSGVTEDRQRALDAFQKAAAMGDPLASYKLGCFLDGQGVGLVAQDEGKALKFKLVAAEAGYALAQQDVASLYARKGDMATALRWLERSAAQGWSDGLKMLASVYNGAQGVERDAAKVDAYFRLYLARSSASEAQLNWLSQFENRLTAAEKKRADDLVSDFKPKPTPLTLKALSGQRAAELLVDGHQ